MASALCTVSFSGSSSVGITKTTMYSLPLCSCSSSSINPCFKTLKFPLSSQLSQLGFLHFSPWNGLKHLGISISAKPQKIGRKAKCRGKVVYASLFGVGAPEALVIGVVALLVFGPKGLAEVARNLGKTLRAFQPTIKELQEVSREFKSTLEREISLDDDPIQTRNTPVSNTNSTSNSSTSISEESQTVPMADPNGASSNNAYSTEDYLKITEEQLNAKQEVMSSPPESQVEPVSQPEAQLDVTSPSPESQMESESLTQAVQKNVASSPPEKSIEPESQPQAIQETTTGATLVQKSESES